MRYFLFILFLLGACCNTNAQLSQEQEVQIDSLKQVIKTAKHDTITVNTWMAWDNIIYISNPKLDFKLNQKIDSLCRLNLAKKLPEKTAISFQKTRGLALNNIGAIYYDQGEYEQALKTHYKSLKIYGDIEDKSGMAASLNNVGRIYYDQGEYEKALEMYTKSLKIRTEIEDKSGIAASLNNIGAIYHGQGEYEKALEAYAKSLKIREKMSDKKGVAGSLINIGIIYMEQEDYEKALEVYEKSLRTYEEIGDKNRTAISLNNIGIIHKEQEEYEKALEVYAKSLKIRTEIGDKSGIAISLNNIGIIYKEQGEYEKALEVYAKSLKAYEEIGYKSGIALSLNNIGNIYLDQGKYEKAKDHCERALAVAQDLGLAAETRDVAQLLFKINKQLNLHNEALSMYELYIASRDSIDSEENQKAVIRQQYKYAYEKQAAADSVKTAEAKKVSDAQLKATKAENARQKLEAEREEHFKYGLYGVLALALLFGLFIFNRFRVTKKQRDIIDLQKQEVETQKEKVDEAYDQLEEKNTEILDSINYAKRIQSAILPPDKLVKQYLENSFVLYKPKDIVAGDFYWMEPFAIATDSEGTSKKGVLFAAADCTGHGVPGAMVSVVCNNGLNRSVREYGLTDPGQILDKTREIVISEFEKSEEEVKDGMDVALCSLQGRTLKYAGAHNPLWIFRKRKVNETTTVISTGADAGSEAEKSGNMKTDSLNESKGSADAGKKSSYSVRGEGNDKPDLSATVEMTGEEKASSDYELIEIKAHKQPIGKYGDPTPYPTHTLELNEGDSFYIFSDGYADQFGGERGKKYKSANFKRLLLSIQNETISRQKELIDAAFENWKGWGGHPLEQLDDVCVIGVKI